jgi:FkbM family methyltransferase
MNAESLRFLRSEVNPRLALAPPLRPIPGWERAEMTVSCRDTDPIPKVPGAGGVFLGPHGTMCQRMHNGLLVTAGAYHGEWMSEIIRRLRGHHEPQEELLFHAALPLVGLGEAKPVMIELGSFWAYYSLWFRSVYIAGRNILVEPDPNSLRIGERNFELNGFGAKFLRAAIGVHNGSTEFRCESDGVARPVRTVSVDGLVRDFGIERIHLLHADIQGAELTMLHGAAETIQRGCLNWLFLSTHHHSISGDPLTSISGDPLTHQCCLDWLRAHKAFIVEEHSVSESFSGDGLIVASFGQEPRLVYPPISRNVPSRSLFRETEYDLSEALKEIDRLRNEISRLSGQ